MSDNPTGHLPGTTPADVLARLAALEADVERIKGWQGAVGVQAAAGDAALQRQGAVEARLERQDAHLARLDAAFRELTVSLSANTLDNLELVPVLDALDATPAAPLPGTSPDVAARLDALTEAVWRLCDAALEPGAMYGGRTARGYVLAALDGPTPAAADGDAGEPKARQMTKAEYERLVQGEWPKPAPTPPAGELPEAADFERAGLGTDRLCQALYGRPPRARDYLGGANAKMLHDAADRIEWAKSLPPALPADAAETLREDADALDVSRQGDDAVAMRGLMAGVAARLRAMAEAVAP